MNEETKTTAPMGAEQPIIQPATAKKDTRIEGSAKEGLVEAVASASMSVVSVLMTLFMNMNVISEMLCMYGFILGVRAVNTYKTCHLWQKKKPKATYVLGIIGIVLNCIAMLLWLIWIAGFFILMFMET